MRRFYGARAGQSSVLPVTDRTDLGNFVNCWKKVRDREADPKRAREADRNWMMVLLGVNTALRFSDLRRLKAGEIRNNYVDQRDLKTGKENRFSLNPEIRREAEAYIRRNGLLDGDYLFTSLDGRNVPLTRQQGYNIIRKAGEMCGLRYPVGTHTLRKTYGYWFYRETGDVVALQTILNHSSPATTLIYIGMRRKEVDEKRAKFVIK